jgi:prephenate dehydrogenase
MALPRFQRLVIQGVGLLGGSLGMALKRRAMVQTIVGLGRSMERLERARQLGAIDEAHTRLESALDGADAIVLAVPPRQIRERFAELAPLLPPGAFVTDVGSVKQRIVEAAEAALPAGTLFVGSHPMAGSEKTGAEHGRSDFYEESACLLTPTERTPAEAVDLARRFWEALGSRVVVIDPAAHDRLLAGVSHLPHVVAAALMQTLARGGDDMETVAAIAGGGLRDTTRIAASDPEMWRQICVENAPALVDRLDDLIAILTDWRGALDKSTPDGKAVEKLFDIGRQARLRLGASECDTRDPVL